MFQSPIRTAIYGLAVVLVANSLSIFPASAQAPAPATAQFGPGTLKVILPEPDAAETFIGPMNLKELSENASLTWSPPDFPDGRPFYESGTRSLQEMAKNVTLRRDIYALEFSFKPMRQIEIDVPQPTGRMAKKMIWYLVFRLRYKGGDLRPKGDTQGSGGPTYSLLYPQIEGISFSGRRCFPLLTLRSENYDKEYLDRVIPTAHDKIVEREKIYVKVHNTVELTTVPIPNSKDPNDPGIWGLATWEDVDPRIDFFSVFVYGLTNAIQMTDGGEQLKKVLHLTFFRPGDTIRMLDDKIRFGVPAFKDPKEFKYALEQYGLKERLDYRWIFR